MRETDIPCQPVKIVVRNRGTPGHSTTGKGGVGENSGGADEGLKARGEIPIGQDLTAERWRQVAWLLQDFAYVFNEIPSKAKGTVHKIVTPEGSIIGIQ